MNADPVVCNGCGGRGSFIFPDGAELVCMECGGAGEFPNAAGVQTDAAGASARVLVDAEGWRWTETAAFLAEHEAQGFAGIFGGRVEREPAGRYPFIVYCIDPAGGL